MPKVSTSQSIFNTGELSPLLMGRTDFDSYKGGLKTCLNSILYVQGGITRRAGTYFSDEVKDSGKATRVVRFQFATEQAYIIEFGNLYCRFKRNNGPVRETALVITGITKASPGVVTYTGTDPSNGDHIDLADITGMSELNGLRVTVANVNAGANTFEMSGVNTTNYTTYVSGGTASVVYEIVTPYLEADLFNLKFSQSADVLYITHPDYAPRKLTRTAHTAWTLTTIVFSDGPYLSVNSGAITITPAAASGSNIAHTASAALFASTDVGRLIRIQHTTQWGWARIVSYTSTTVVNADIGSAYGATTASAFWRLGLFSDTTGYPSCSTFFENRLFYGGCPASVQQIDGSKSGDYDNFEPTNPADSVVADNNAVSGVMTSDDVQSVRWMKGEERGLMVGTVNGEWIVRPSQSGEALSPTNIVAKQSTAYGSNNVSPVQSGKAVLFMQTSGRKLRELAYVFEVDGFRAPDMSLLSEHITRGGIIEMSFQQEPNSLVWLVRADGTLVGFTYERDQKVLGWHRHELGGYSDAANTVFAKVESVASIPTSDGTRDETWMVVQRYINGETKRYIEYFSKLWEQDDDQADSFHVDSGLTYDGVSTTTVQGLHHLVGEIIKCQVDGAAHPDVTVQADGSVTLVRAGEKIQLGYGYMSDGEMLRIEAGAADGTAQGKTQRIHRVAIRVLDSLGLQIGPSFDKLSPVIFRTSANPTNTAVPLFTGDLQETWEGDYSTEALICWRWEQTFPGTILGVYPQMHTSDR